MHALTQPAPPLFALLGTERATSQQNPQCPALICERHFALVVLQVVAVKCFKAALAQRAPVTFLRAITAPIGPE